jgi:hypothetical protein
MKTPPSAGNSGDNGMRAFSFILVFVFVLAGPSMAGSVESGLPGIGTFAYGTAPVAAAVR